MTGRPRGRLLVAALALAVSVAANACGGSGASPATSGPVPGARDPSPALSGGAGPDWLGPGAGGASASCATPAPSEPAPICTDPAASSAAGSPGAAAPVTGGGASTGKDATVSASPAPAASPLAAASPAGGDATLAGAAPPGPSAGSTPRPSGTPAPSADPGAQAAPTSATGFKVRETVVPISFPLPATSAYGYGDGWRAPRVGIARAYNQIRGVAPDGTWLRAHDGLDLLVKTGTPVLAPFSGTVIDPAKRWKPWDPSRYGKVVVIESTEPTSPGYRVILAHLSTVAVKVGDAVERGEVVGRTGKTGNAAGTAPHLHLEIRAPFLIRYGYAKVIRRLDVFDAEPSVRAADPRAR